MKYYNYNHNILDGGKKLKVLVVFFSSTGNTRYGVELVKIGIESVQGSTCDIVEISSFSNRMIKEYDLIGFASPVFAFKPALNMLELIDNLPQKNNKPCFTFTTYAGQSSNTSWIFTKKLNSRGYTVIAHKGILSQGSWTTIRKPGKLEFENEPSVETQNSVIEFAKKLHSTFKEFKKGNITPLKPKFKLNIFHLISYLYNHTVLDRFFVTKVDEKKCARCGLCIRICPTGRMNFNRFPNPKGTCIGCYRCINLCPQDAIEGWFTKGKLRYKGLDSSVKVYSKKDEGERLQKYI